MNIGSSIVNLYPVFLKYKNTYKNLRYGCIEDEEEEKLSEEENIALEQIKFTLQRHKGTAQVLIYLPEGKILRTDDSLWAEPSKALENQLGALLGPENVKMN